MSDNNITVDDTLCRGVHHKPARPGDPLTPRWRQVTFWFAHPKEKIWRSKGMKELCPKGWKRIRIDTSYSEYVRFTCYNAEYFSLITDAWIEEMWLKLLLIQE